MDSPTLIYGSGIWALARKPEVHDRNTNKMLWEELIICFPFTAVGFDKQKMCACMCKEVNRTIQFEASVLVLLMGVI
jgi:hypothetical protein